jgi:nucleoside phosphorylase
MPLSSRILVVAATARELAPPDDWRSLQCGVGPVEAAIATTLAIAHERPGAILHVGIAGARRAAGFAPGSLVIGTEARYVDLGVPAEWAPNTIPTSVRLLAGVQRLFPNARVAPIGTSGRVGGTLGTPVEPCDVEAMEGFGVMRAAQQAGVPVIEVRAIANEIEEQDRARWHFDLAFKTITDATPLLVAAVRDALRQPLAGC